MNAETIQKLEAVMGPISNSKVATIEPLWAEYLIAAQEFAELGGNPRIFSGDENTFDLFVVPTDWTALAVMGGRCAVLWSGIE